jgi:glyoxylase-like metal-dependent hydrolase (beta-lactamase superfamily II)
MDIKTEKVGFLEVNCYIIPSEKDGCVYIIDPGASPDRIAESAKSYGMKDYKILLTHAHIDHISGSKRIDGTFFQSRLFTMNPDDILTLQKPCQ